MGKTQIMLTCLLKCKQQLCSVLCAILVTCCINTVSMYKQKSCNTEVDTSLKWHSINRCAFFFWFVWKGWLGCKEREILSCGRGHCSYRVQQNRWGVGWGGRELVHGRVRLLWQISLSFVKRKICNRQVVIFLITNLCVFQMSTLNGLVLFSVHPSLFL